MRHSGQMSSSAWRLLWCNLHVEALDGVCCPDDPSGVLPLLVWLAALDDDSPTPWLWHERGGLVVQRENGTVRVPNKADAPAVRVLGAMRPGVSACGDAMV